MTTHHSPHQGQPLLTMGEPLEHARAAMVMIHGRGARAEDILTLAHELPQSGCAFLAPQAAGNVWYPNRFLDPIVNNEPWLSSALAVLAHVLTRVMEAGVPPERTLLLGFSQGACLTLEFVARNARRYGGVAGLSGGLIGPDGTPRDYATGLEGTPVFLGCSDVDPHIPKARVLEAADLFQRLGGNVTVRLYPNMPHTVSPDEIDHVRGMLAALLGQSPSSA